MILICTQSQAIKAALSALDTSTSVVVDTKKDLAGRIVKEAGVMFTMIVTDDFNLEWQKFTSSLRSCFPRLEIYLALPPSQASQGEGLGKVIPNTAEAVLDRIRAELASEHPRDKRKHPRFDWPLQGALRFADDTVRSYRVRSLSSSGAFLECRDGAPAAGSTGLITIQLYDFNVMTGCRTLNKRSAGETLPEGFGIQFTDLSDISRRIIEGIVQDELMASLLEPEKPPHPPSMFAANSD